MINNYKKINSNAARLITLILAIWLASIASKLVWQLLEQDTSSTDTKNFITQPSNESKLHLPYHLFGVLQSSTQQDYNNVNKTRLNLILMGILKQQNNSLAIIKNGSIKSKIYKLGDFITPSVSIKEI
jgi:type II secretory pathway component PulC